MELFNSYNPRDIYEKFKLYRKIKKDLFSILAQTCSEYPLDTRLLHANHGSLKFTDAYTLKNILQKYKPATILEIGSFLGFSTRWLLEVSKSWNPQLTAIDPNIRHRIFDDPRSFAEKLNSEFLPNNLEIVTGFFGHYDDNIYYDYEHYQPKQTREYVDKLATSRERIDKNWNRKFEFIFIDGDHSYKSVMNNFDIAVELLEENGCIAFHDALTWEGVDKALKEIKFQFKNKAEVHVYGKLDKAILKLFRAGNDGIGFFRLIS